ncbi:MAG: ribosome-associated translation inhibitor RaiA [Gammaproteobacteria bacterium]|nr:ribosome-associated translation inhibitor RaiA [Gammaproteobacteria bacterium]
MQLNVSGHHVDMSDSLKNYVQTKLARLERHFDNVTNVNVVLTVEKQARKAEASVNVSGGQLFANAESDDMYAAIDALADKLDRQIRKHKEKLSDHHRADGGLKSLEAE